MNCSRGEVIPLPIPFTDLTSRKVRPAVVIGRGSLPGDLFDAPTSSRHQPLDLALKDQPAANPNVPWGAKAQIATIEDRLTVKALGQLSSRDLTSRDNRVRDGLGL